MMPIYQIDDSPAAKDYRGSGKCLAAINSGKVVALRYIGTFQPDLNSLPGWVRAVLNKIKLTEKTDLKKLTEKQLSLIKFAACDAGHPAVGPRGGIIKAIDIAKEIKALLSSSAEARSDEHKSKCEQELKDYGVVYSGMCAFGEFVSNDDSAGKSIH